MPNLIPEPGSFFDRIITVVLANILWFVCAVPVITLPAATAGLFAVLSALVRGHDVEIFATFFGTMRRQWFKSTVIMAADVVIGVVIAINFHIVNMMNPPELIFWFFRSIYIFLIIAALMANLYLWPILVLFDFDLRHLIMMSIRLAFTHPMWSLLTLSLALLSLALTVFVPPALSVLIIFSTTVWIINWGAWQIIKRYTTPQDLADRARYIR
ncbi:MAG: DUF624 domain-containing protein [Anaerolineae bacterium]|nr:DUF624 domain-containing protein [Anaerolineae bacterium]